MEHYREDKNVMLAPGLNIDKKVQLGVGTLSSPPPPCPTPPLPSSILSTPSFSSPGYENDLLPNLNLGHAKFEPSPLPHDLEILLIHARRTLDAFARHADREHDIDALARKGTHALGVREAGRAHLELFLAVGDKVGEVRDRGEGFGGEDDLLGRWDDGDGRLALAQAVATVA